MRVSQLTVRVPSALAVLVLVLFPVLFSGFFTSTVGIRSLWLGIAAASLTFLAAYGGMVSLAQTALYGIAGFTMANLAASDGGVSHVRIFFIHLGNDWSPWQATIGGVVAATLIGLAFGFVSRRSYGIYFLMLTLALAVLTFYFFGQVSQLSGFGGVNNVPRPSLVGDAITAPTRLYYVTLVSAAAVYVLLRSIVRTPFGLTLQGIRDDPIRTRSLGFRVALHRTLAFGLGAFVASIAGILSVWYNGQISPGSIDLSRSINILAIAVVGGLSRIEGAWLGAFAFTLVDYAVKRWVGDGFGTSLNGVERFETWFGLIFVLILVVSPSGIVGILAAVRKRLDRRSGPPAMKVAAKGGEGQTTA